MNLPKSVDKFLLKFLLSVLALTIVISTIIAAIWWAAKLLGIIILVAIIGTPLYFIARRRYNQWCSERESTNPEEKKEP